jgi:hypothetical protein
MSEIETRFTLHTGHGGQITTTLDECEKILRRYQDEQWRGIRHTRQWKRSMQQVQAALLDEWRKERAELGEYDDARRRQAQ